MVSIRKPCIAIQRILLADLCHDRHTSRSRSGRARVSETAACRGGFTFERAAHGRTPRDLQMSFRGRHEQARDALRRLLAWRPQAVVMCHGLPARENASAFVAAGFSREREK
jgi:hypothetical protein